MWETARAGGANLQRFSKETSSLPLVPSQTRRTLSSPPPTTCTAEAGHAEAVCTG